MFVVKKTSHLIFKKSNLFLIKKYSSKIQFQSNLYNINNSNLFRSKLKLNNFSINRHLSSNVDEFLNSINIFTKLSNSTPVVTLQNKLVYFHDITGLPWYATIIITTFFLRFGITLPLALYQHRILAKIEKISLEMPAIVEELKKETAIAIRKFHWNEQKAKFMFRKSVKKQWNNLVIRDNCHPAKASILIWIQFPAWIFYSVALRNLVYMLPEQDTHAKIIFMELSGGGFSWIPNLTVPDASLILPIFLGLTNLAIIEIQTLIKIEEEKKFQKITKNFFRGITLIMVPIAAMVPSCLSLFWATSSIFGLIQNLIILSPKFRRICFIPHTKRELEKPYSHLWNKIKQKFTIKNKINA